MLLFVVATLFLLNNKKKIPFEVFHFSYGRDNQFLYVCVYT